MSEQKLYHVAVVGATGAVGEQMIRMLESRNFPVGELKLLSSARSAGTKLKFRERSRRWSGGCRCWERPGGKAEEGGRVRFHGGGLIPKPEGTAA